MLHLVGLDGACSTRQRGVPCKDNIHSQRVALGLAWMTAAVGASVAVKEWVSCCAGGVKVVDRVHGCGCRRHLTGRLQLTTMTNIGRTT